MSASAPLQLPADGLPAVRIPTGTRIPPFEDEVGALPVGPLLLAEAQERALSAVGARLVDRPPATGPFLVLSDRCFFTAEALRLLLAAGPGRLLSTDTDWWRLTGPLQEVPRPGLYELGLHPGGTDQPVGMGLLEELDPVEVDLELLPLPAPRLHPALARAMVPLRGGAALVHQVHHWSHLSRLAPLAVFAGIAQDGLDWQRAGLLAKLRAGISVMGKARSLRKDRLARAVSHIHPEAEVHPTAVIEASTIEAGATVAPYAVVRGSHLCAEAVVQEHSLVQMSVLRPRATVGRQSMVTAALLLEEAMVSGGGYQASVFGRGSFTAWGAVLLDMSFGRPVQVDHQGQRVSSEHHFLGCAVGHGAVIGNGVRVNHGQAIPNEAVLVAPGDDLLRSWDGAPVDQGPLVVRGGRPVPLKKR